MHDMVQGTVPDSITAYMAWHLIAALSFIQAASTTIAGGLCRVGSAWTWQMASATDTPCRAISMTREQEKVLLQRRMLFLISRSLMEPLDYQVEIFLRGGSKLRDKARISNSRRITIARTVTN